MLDSPEIILFAALLTIPFGLNFIASRSDYNRYVDALFLSAIIAVIWAFTVSASVLWEFPTSKMFHPLVDLIGLSVAVTAYMTQKQAWKLTLAFLFLAQLCAHAWFWWEGQPASLGREYVGSLNLLWFAQLACVGWPGGVHCVARAFAYLRRDGRLPHLARH